MDIRIKKFDPAVDPEPYYINHEVPFKEKMTLLEVIVYVHENFEAVNYDYSCHGRMCGRCAVMLDTIPALACCTPITNESHTIEPLKGHTVIHDLIVDKHDLDEKLSTQYLRVRTEPITADQINDFDGAAAKKMYDVVNCTRCGCCDAYCPVYQTNPDLFVGPASMVAVYLRHKDSYDQADRLLEAVSKGIFHCTLCGQCDDVCPRPEITHVEMFTELRAEAEKRGLKPSYAEE